MKKLPIINLDELKAKLCDINPKDCFTNTPISEIFKTSSDFKIELLNRTASLHRREGKGTKIIKLTFMWNGNTYQKIDGSQTWYMDVEEYFRMKTRFVIVEKIIKI